MNNHPPYQALQTDRPEELHALLLHALACLGDVVVIDNDGKIVFVSEGYLSHLNDPDENVLGKHISDVLEDSVLPSVLDSGNATWGSTFLRNGNLYLVNRVPIMESGKISGVVAQALINSDSNQFTPKQFEQFMMELNYYREKYERVSLPQNNIDTIVGVGPVMQELKNTLRMISSTRSSVLLCGESGTGKEVFAGALHNLSPRKDKPFIKLNCAAIPENLIESELFGYVGGAFTGALKNGKIGDFEAASGGTLFLDEIDSLSLNMQAKLLRAIQEREIKKIGSTKPIPIDVRFIFATNKDLLQMIKENTFREDLYYRINVLNLRIPPLRERREDIPVLAKHFVEKFNKELGKPIQGITTRALLLLEEYDWPGNIRQLENCIERAFNYASGSLIDEEDIDIPGLRPQQVPSDAVSTLREEMDAAEKHAILRALQRCGNNKTQAAKQLGIDRRVLYQKITRLGINN